MGIWSRIRGLIPAPDRIDGYQPQFPTLREDVWKDPNIEAQMKAYAMASGRMDDINLDGFVNQLTGIGDWMHDKTFGGSAGGPDFIVDLLSGIACENRWRGSDLGGRVIESIPDEMTREGWKVQIQPSDEDDEEVGEDKASPFGGGDTKPGKAFPFGKKSGNKNEEDKGKTKTQPTGSKNPSGPDKQDAFPPHGAAQGAPQMPAPDDGPPRAPMPEIDDESTKLEQAIMDACEELGFDDKLTEALQFERAYGGAGILIGADDGQTDLTKPLDEERIRSIDWVNTFRGGWDGEIVAWSYYQDPAKPNYGMPEMYMLRNLGVPVARIPAPGQTITMRELAPAGQNNLGTLVSWVHASRFLIFPGIAVSRRARVQMRGWGDSIFTRVDRILRHYDQTWDGIANLMTDFSQGTLKVEGLAAALAANNTKASEVLTKKARTLSLSRSIARILLIDAKEEFGRDTASLSGLPELLDQFTLRFAAAADMPVSLLMGQVKGGLGDAGNTDIRFFYDRVKSKQNRRLTPRIKRFVRLLEKAQQGPTKGKITGRITIMHNPLYQMSALEKADVRLKTNQADDLEIKNQVLTPEEVAASEWAGSEWSSDRTIDFKGRAEMAKQQEKDKADKLKQQQKIMSESARAGVQPGQLALTHPEHPLNLPQPPQKEGDKKPVPAFAKKGDEDEDVSWSEDADWSEEDHPRDKDGTFAGSGGGGMEKSHAREAQKHEAAAKESHEHAKNEKLPQSTRERLTNNAKLHETLAENHRAAQAASKQLKPITSYPKGELKPHPEGREMPQHPGAAPNAVLAEYHRAAAQHFKERGEHKIAEGHEAIAQKYSKRAKKESH